MEQLIGSKLDDRYLIEEMIGVGGMCNVYRAFDSEKLITVAVKILRDKYATDSESLRRFRNETKAILTLNHPDIIKIIEVNLDSSNPYIVMEYVSGMTLKEYIEANKPIKAQTAASITGHILSALQVAHDSGIAHRDIKPQNIMITKDNKIKVMDFGIARFAMSQNHTLSGNAIGSVHYISPEQALGNAVDNRTDIYSVGVILFEMLTGKVPFESDSPVSVALKQVEQTPASIRSLNGNVPVGLEQITMHAMAKNPDDRYSSCRDMMKDLKVWLDNPKAVFKYNVSKPATRYGGASNDSFQQLKEKASEVGDVSKRMVKRAERSFKKGDRFTKLLWITGGSIVFTIIFVFILSFIYSPFGGKKDISMPNLIGLNYESVLESNDYHVNLSLQSEEYSTEFDFGQIMYQSPSAGKNVKSGSTVYVKVSKGANSMIMPNFVNQESTLVYAKLLSMGLQYTFEEITSDTITEGCVIRTTPESGAVVNEGAIVTVIVSSGSGKAKSTVPDVIGSEAFYAVSSLEAAGFSPFVTYEITDDYNKVGTVIRQSPSYPSKVPLGSRVTLVVGSETESSGATVDIIFTPDNFPADTSTVEAVMNGKVVSVQEFVYDSNANQRVTVTLEGLGSSMVDIRVNGKVYKSASVDFDNNNYYWTADYSEDFNG